MHHPKNEHVAPVHAINGYLLAHRKAPRPGAEIFVTGSARVGEGGEKKIERVATSMLPLS
jgi:hypothetical protein